MTSGASGDGVARSGFEGTAGERSGCFGFAMACGGIRSEDPGATGGVAGENGSAGRSAIETGDCFGLACGISGSGLEGTRRGDPGATGAEASTGVSPRVIEASLSPGSVVTAGFVLTSLSLLSFNETLAVAIRNCRQVSISPQTNRHREHVFSDDYLFAPLTWEILAPVSAFNVPSVPVAFFSRRW